MALPFAAADWSGVGGDYIGVGTWVTAALCIALTVLSARRFLAASRSAAGQGQSTGAAFVVPAVVLGVAAAVLVAAARAQD